jgi:hypothetical protein
MYNGKLAFKRNDNIILNEIRYKRTHFIWFYLYEVPKGGKFTQTKIIVKFTRTYGWGGEKELLLSGYRISLWYKQYYEKQGTLRRGH